jgi:ABC-type transport system involved in multi-copper enzyme maturation permease subunit
MSAQFNAAQWRQIWTIARLEVFRAFLSKRSIWIYVLAFFGIVVFAGHAVSVEYKKRLYSSSTLGRITGQQFAAVDGQSMPEVIKTLGQPYDRYEWQRPRQDDTEAAKQEKRDIKFDNMSSLNYVSRDGDRFQINFENDRQVDRDRQRPTDFDKDKQIFAGFFHYFYLRLAIFFGCLGIFMNLFRGEALDKTLHFWFLAPVRRDVLLVGKFLSGLIAGITIFGVAIVLTYAAMLWPQSAGELQSHMANRGYAEAWGYFSSAALAVFGYGSVFLAAGLLLQNPLIPAAIMLVWEAANPFLPNLFQKMSVLYYAQSLAPMSAPMDPDTPALLRLLLAPAAPASKWAAALGMIGLSLLVLLLARQSIRRMEVNYSADS